MQTRIQTEATLSGENDSNLNCCNFCSTQPPQPIILLLLTLLMTTTATAMLASAIMTDHWEEVEWNKIEADNLTKSRQTLNWVLNDKIGVLRTKEGHHTHVVFLVPMHGGIWTLCLDLALTEIKHLRHHYKFPIGTTSCISYLEASSEISRKEDIRGSDDYQTTLQPHLRMQNLSISCSLVCLIILGSAALLGAFGVCQKQISAILITGIMYLLAALFALFTLMIMHFKRQHGRKIIPLDFNSGTDGLVGIRGTIHVAENLLSARIITTSWSLDLGWGGVVLCSMASILWILLSKILRYNPISAFAI